MEVILIEDYEIWSIKSLLLESRGIGWGIWQNRSNEPTHKNDSFEKRTV